MSAEKEGEYSHVDGTTSKCEVLLLNQLNNLYPEVDLTFMNQIIIDHKKNVRDIQQFLEKAIEEKTAPSRRKIQVLQRTIMYARCSKENQLWSCPECKSCQVISKIEPPEVVSCVEIISCGQFCFKCRRKPHGPFNCRQSEIDETLLPEPQRRKLASNDTTDIIKNEVMDGSIFDKVARETPIDQILNNSCRVYKLVQSSQDPSFRAILDLLKTTIEVKGKGNHSIPKGIRYAENDNLAARFNACKEFFRLDGIPVTERLVFHGTDAESSSIFSKGLLLKCIRRTKFGYGIYFTDFASEALATYGKNLILCRVLIGNPYVGSQLGVPDGFQSKIVDPNKSGLSSYILIDKEAQILPIIHFVNSPILPALFK